MNELEKSIHDNANGLDYTLVNVRYNQLLLSGELSGYLAKLDKQAEEQLALTIRQMQDAEGVTEALKVENQLEWVRRMNSIRSRAEEIIKTELIFV